jgi:glutamate 5-kinase
VLLSDVDGLYTAPPGLPDARKIGFVRSVAAVQADVSQPGPSGVGSGGMASKLAAARLATSAGIPVVLARWDQAGAVLAGQNVGTAFAPVAHRRPRRLAWLADASEIQGRLHVDDGAARALITTPASLLAAGVVRIEGDFGAGDPVEIVAPDGAVIGRGLVGFAASELPAMLGRSSDDLAAALGSRFGHEVVHRDDLVLVRGAGLLSQRTHRPLPASRDLP